MKEQGILDEVRKKIALHKVKYKKEPEVICLSPGRYNQLWLEWNTPANRLTPERDWQGKLKTIPPTYFYCLGVLIKMTPVALVNWNESRIPTQEEIEEGHRMMDWYQIHHHTIDELYQKEMK